MERITCSLYKLGIKKLTAQESYGFIPLVVDVYDATGEVRKEGYKAPIIALTAHALNEERQRCLEVGFNDHLSKPVNRESLFERIAHYGSRDRAASN